MEEKETKDKLLMMNDYYDDIKRELIKNNVTKAVKQYSINRSDLNTYYEVGRLLSEAGKHYGDNIIKKYAEMLSLDLESKYESSYLYKMKRFYLLIEKVATLSPKLTYGHYVELLPYEDVNKVKYYIKLVEDNNLTIRELRAHIKSNEYERLPETAKNKLIKENETSVIDFVKNPIVIKTNDNEEHINEKKLQSLIMEYLSSFLDELGDGFLFKKNE